MIQIDIAELKDAVHALRFHGGKTLTFAQSNILCWAADNYLQNPQQNIHETIPDESGSALFVMPPKEAGNYALGIWAHSHYEVIRKYLGGKE